MKKGTVMKDPKIAICNVGIGGNYAVGSNRLIDSLDHVGNRWDRFIYVNQYPEGSPTHQQAPYAFKLHALMAAERAGADIIVWADSAVWAIRDAADLIKHVERQGYYFVHSGYSYGQWTSDTCMMAMGEKRDDQCYDAAVSPMIMACFYAIDLRRPAMKRFFQEVKDVSLSHDGALLRGDWKNDNRQVSYDPRCTGHRHDQSVISILIKRYKLKIDIAHETFFQYYDIPGDYVGTDWHRVDLGRFKPSIAWLTQGV